MLQESRCPGHEGQQPKRQGRLSLLKGVLRSLLKGVFQSLLKAVFRSLYGMDEMRNPIKPAETGSKWPREALQGQSSHLLTTSSQLGGVLRARSPHLGFSYPSKRMPVSLQVGVFTRVSSLLWRWGPLTKALPSQSGLLVGLQEFYTQETEEIPRTHSWLLIGCFQSLQQIRGLTRYDHIRSSGATYHFAIFSLPIMLIILDTLNYLS